MPLPAGDMGGSNCTEALQVSWVYPGNSRAWSTAQGSGEARSGGPIAPPAGDNPISGFPPGAKGNKGRGGDVNQGKVLIRAINERNGDMHWGVSAILATGVMAEAKLGDTHSNATCEPRGCGTV